MKVRTLTPDLWAMLPKSTTDCLTMWWESLDVGSIRDLVMLSILDGETIEALRIVRDEGGQAQLDPHRLNEFLKETIRITAELPACWPDEEVT